MLMGIIATKQEIEYGNMNTKCILVTIAFIYDRLKYYFNALYALSYMNMLILVYNIKDTSSKILPMPITMCLKVYVGWFILKFIVRSLILQFRIYYCFVVN